MPIIKVLASQRRTTAFEVTANSRKDAEASIAERLRSDTELVWKDGHEGINVACIWGNDTWRPRARFFLTDDGSHPLQIEDKSAAAPTNGGGEQ
jgi:hypothetical protein